MKKFLSDFKAFALKGNVMSLAIGIIIGGAFQAIVASLTGDIISPIIGIFAKTDFSNLVWNVNGAEIKYGSFITAVLNFLIIAMVIFLMIRLIAKATERGKKKEEAAPTTKVCKFCQSQIAIKAVRCPHCTSELPEED